MKNNFQTILLGVFLAFAVFAVMIFSGILPIGQKKADTTEIVGNVTVWGTFDSSLMRDVFENLGAQNRDLRVNYIEKNKTTYEDDLIKAFAKGEGPDLFLVSNKTLLKNQSFIYEIPYQSYPKRTFQNTFIDGADIFMDENGVDALPIVADPLVIFYNKSMLSNSGIATPPLYWDELFDLNSKLTEKRGDGSIVKSMIALGTYQNITNAKDILAMLFLQSRNNIINRSKGEVSVDFEKDSGLSGSINDELVNFFVEFSNPLSTNYSWNKGVIPSRDFFTGNKLAFYIGHASELFDIEEINPNLSFDVTEMLQIRNEKNKTTAGDIYAVAINKNSKNLQGAFGVAYKLSSPEYVDLIAKALSLPPALKENLKTNPEDPYLYSFYKSAISLKAWLDPDQEATDEIFERFVENVISGRTSAGDALNRLQSEINLVLKNE